MNKGKILVIGISIILAFITLAVASAAIYQTPGAVPECDNVSFEVPILEDLEEDSKDIKVDLTNRGSLIAWIFVGVIIVVGLFFIIRREIIMKKKKSSGLVLGIVNDALKNKEKIVEIEAMDEGCSPEELNELVSELGLDEVIDKMEEIDKNEPKR